jgi:hypothetical protein
MSHPRATDDRRFVLVCGHRRPIAVDVVSICQELASHIVFEASAMASR